MLIEARTGKTIVKLNKQNWPQKKEQKMQINFQEKTHPNDVELVLKYAFVRESEQEERHTKYIQVPNFANV